MSSTAFMSLIDGANHITVLSGAGISTPSGIPDFRGKNGLWKQYNPEETLSLKALNSNPAAFWEFWETHRKDIGASHQPNHAHRFFADLEQKGKNVEIITQNIDGLHEKAGSQHVYTLHGSISKPLICMECKTPNPGKSRHELCGECGGMLRPDVVLFGEQLDEGLWQKATQAIKACDLLLIIGTSLQVKPVANLPKKVAHHPRKKMIVVNRQPTPFNRFAQLIVEEDLGEFFQTLSA